MEKTDTIVDNSALKRGVIAWIVAFAGLTALGVLWLTLTGVDQQKDFSPAIILIAYAPSCAALGVVGLFSGMNGVRALLRPVGKWRVGLQWYALVLLGPLALVFLTRIIYLALGGALPPQWIALPALGSAIGPLIAGSLGEEIGWRGFAQPFLQKRYGMLSASVIVGVLWATWHLWPAIAPGGLVYTTLPDVIQTYVRLISTAVIYGWIYNRTRGSLLLVMLAHAGHNLAVDLCPPPTEEAALLLAFLYLLAALAVFWVEIAHNRKRMRSAA